MVYMIFLGVHINGRWGQHEPQKISKFQFKKKKKLTFLLTLNQSCSQETNFIFEFHLIS